MSNSELFSKLSSPILKSFNFLLAFLFSSSSYHELFIQFSKYEIS